MSPTALRSFLVLCLALLVLGGCAATRAVMSAGRMAELKAAQERGDSDRMLELVRLEIPEPGVDLDGYRADLRVIGINALAGVAARRGFNAAMDEEALRYYREAQQLAVNDPTRLGLARITLSQYYQGTRRAGRALPLLAEDLAYQRLAGNEYQQVRTLDALASAHNDMGDYDMRDRFRFDALALAERIFSGSAASARTDHQWLQYQSILKRGMTDASDYGDSVPIERLWPLALRITQDRITPVTGIYLETAKAFTVAGNTKRARELLEQGRRVWAGERAKSTQVAAAESDFICTDMMIATAEHGSSAGSLAKSCLDKMRGLGLELSPGTLFQAGLADEVAGDDAAAGLAFDQAAQLAEGLRGSYTVAERAAFFSNVAIKGIYWGRVRVAARRAAAPGAGPDAFFDAVRASEDMRARQLGDLIGDDSQASAAELRGYAEHLPPNALVVSVVSMDESTVVSAFGNDTRRVTIVPIGRKALTARVERLVAALSNPGSDPRAIEAALTTLSADVYGGIQPLLAGRSAITFLPDGPLALIPATLLSANPKTYRPIGLDADVTLAPAVRFLARRSLPAPSKASLWALADPAYPKTLEMPTAELAANGAPQQLASVNGARAVTRGRLRSNAAGQVTVPRLPETKLEVDSIARLFSAGSSRIETGAAASKTTLLAADLRQVPYLHFATHGALAGEIPGLGEPALILAAGKDAADSLLLASEAEQLKLNATLTVLSACNTGSGRVTSGEGVMGLSRAFLVAGSRSVMVSMWPVESNATVELMVAFYKLHRGGDRPATALRKAMAQIRAKRPHPMYWAPFILVGS